MLPGVIMLLLRRKLLGHYIEKQQKQINKYSFNRLVYVLDCIQKADRLQ